MLSKNRLCLSPIYPFTFTVTDLLVFVNPTSRDESLGLALPTACVMHQFWLKLLPINHKALLLNCCHMTDFEKQIN